MACFLCDKAITARGKLVAAWLLQVEAPGEVRGHAATDSGQEEQNRKIMRKTNLYLHNQWRVGNFYAQKPVKAWGGSFEFVLGKN